jgi:hypothetical protein
VSHPQCASSAFISIASCSRFIIVCATCKARKIRCASSPLASRATYGSCASTSFTSPISATPMLMRRLLEGLLAGGVVLVTTSNQHPDQLYEHGLQRAQFVPPSS